MARKQQQQQITFQPKNTIISNEDRAHTDDKKKQQSKVCRKFPFRKLCLDPFV